MRAGGGIVIGGEPVEALVEGDFRGSRSTLDTGIRSMLTVALVHEGETSAALVLASTEPSAYTARDLELVRRVGEAIVGRVMGLMDTQPT